MTKMAASPQTAARLRLSWKAPMFVTTSPKSATLTAPVSRCWAVSAAPTVIGRSAGPSGKYASDIP
jgi:hypothetical protein